MEAAREKQKVARQMKELRMLQSGLPPDIVCTPKGDRLDRYSARIDGPCDTPYEGGRFRVDVVLTESYPFEPPSVKFVTPIYHPNIDNHGNICLEVLKSGKNGCWSPSWTLDKVLISLSVLLQNPNPQDPLMPEIADQMLSDNAAYLKAARECTAKHAAPVDDPDEDEDEDEDGSGATISTETAVASSATATTKQGLSKLSQAAAGSGRHKPGLSRKSASPSPGISSLLSPVTGKIPGAAGIRRLGLSRSRSAAPKPLAPAPAPVPSSSSSQAESVDMASSDEVAGVTIAEPKSAKKTPKRRITAARLSLVMSSSSSQTRPPKMPTPPSKRRKVAVSEVATDEESQTRSQKSIELGSIDEDVVAVDYDCLLSPEEQHNGLVVLSVAETPPPISLELTDSLFGQKDEPMVDRGVERLFGSTGSTGSSAGDNGSEGSSGREDCAKSPEAVEKRHSDEQQQGVNGKENAGDRHDRSSPNIGSSTNAGAGAGAGADADADAAMAKPPTTPADKGKGRSKGKGKAVDRSEVLFALSPVRAGGSNGVAGASVAAAGAGQVLYESHFGPLDLGLPPIKVSSQRGLMRRSRAPKQ
ncbi:Ubiquitin-conjugating enzyme E2 T [Coemansia sp. Benny D115]|nr:Ubiquitin-conjugating enzyme E2 T [Coemansia sp. Benny D115]